MGFFSISDRFSSDLLYKFLISLSFGKFNQLDFRYNFIDYEHKEFENNVDFYSVSLAKNTHNFKFEIFSIASCKS